MPDNTHGPCAWTTTTRFSLTWSRRIAPRKKRREHMDASEDELWSWRHQGWLAAKVAGQPRCSHDRAGTRVGLHHDEDAQDVR
jgi:hypothetical protein